MKKLLSITVAVALAVSACAPQYGPNRGYNNGGYNSSGISKENIGMLAGAAAGGIMGSNVGKGKGATAATIGGAILGGLVGSGIGASLDRADMAYANSSTQNALEQTTTGTTSRWQNPDSGNSGAITPTRTYQNSGGQYCREFTQTVMIGGRNESATGTACRQPDGTWRIVN